MFIDYEFDHALVDLFEWSWVIECLCELFTEHGGVSREEGERFDSNVLRGICVMIWGSLKGSCRWICELDE